VQTGHLEHTLTGLIVRHASDAVVTLSDREELKFWNPETGALQKTVTFTSVILQTLNSVLMAESWFVTDRKKESSGKRALDDS
jgi:hypothetical protein